MVATTVATMVATTAQITTMSHTRNLQLQLDLSLRLWLGKDRDTDIDSDKKAFICCYESFPGALAGAYLCDETAMHSSR